MGMTSFNAPSTIAAIVVLRINIIYSMANDKNVIITECLNLSFIITDIKAPYIIPNPIILKGVGINTNTCSVIASINPMINIIIFFFLLLDL